MPVTIQDITPGSAAASAKPAIAPGDILLRIGERDIDDVLDYRFYMLEETLTLHLRRPDGSAYAVCIEKEEYEEPGLCFESYLMDEQRTCRNKCIFCFVDQMPKGLRPTLYVKDDDSRMSFLFGNYITLTNLTERDVRRIVEMRLSPVNISVHTTDPALRVQMMKNPKAGDSLRFLAMLADGGIMLNTQIVLCPGVNDGAALKKSLTDLAAFYPAMQSIAVVPVGLTKHRQGLSPLRLFTPAEAADVVAQVEALGDRLQKTHGERICYAADEFYLLAGKAIPSAPFYGDFNQLENGVGLLSLLQSEWAQALEEEPPAAPAPTATIATGQAAAPFLRTLLAHPACQGKNVKVEAIPNRLFGETVTVAGLICGEDIAYALSGKVEGRLLIPSVMLRHEQDRFLDDMTVETLSARLGAAVEVVDVDGWALLQALHKPGRTHH